MNIKREGDSYVITVGNVQVISEGLLPLLVVVGVCLFAVFMILSAIF